MFLCFFLFISLYHQTTPRRVVIVISAIMGSFQQQKAMFNSKRKNFIQLNLLCHKNINLRTEKCFTYTKPYHYIITSDHKVQCWWSFPSSARIPVSNAVTAMEVRSIFVFLKSQNEKSDLSGTILNLSVFHWKGTFSLRILFWDKLIPISGVNPSVTLTIYRLLF